MPLTWPNKDPDETLDYLLDWSKRLDGDTISTSEWTVPAGITNEADTNTTTTATIWLSGGTAGVTYTLHNRIVTAGARTMDQSVAIHIRER